MYFVGTKWFHEGSSWGFFGGLGQLFLNKEEYDVYACGRCGKMEFFQGGMLERMEDAENT